MNLICLTLLIMLLIGLISSGCLEKNVLLDKKEECVGESSEGKYCCLIRNSTTASCFEVEKSKFTGRSELTINKTEHHLDYGPNAVQELIESPEGTACGPYTPTNHSECNYYSRNDNSCCFYKTSNRSKCIWAGIKYKGETRLSIQNETISILCNAMKYFFNF
jgi:hypothetical protein